LKFSTLDDFVFHDCSKGTPMFHILDVVFFPIHIKFFVVIQFELFRKINVADGFKLIFERGSIPVINGLDGIGVNSSRIDP